MTLFGSPEQVRAKVLSSSSVWLHWTDPSLGRNQQLTDNRYYNVHYQVSSYVITTSTTRPASVHVCISFLYLFLYHQCWRQK